MSKQYYRYDEIVDCMKAHALDLIGDELNYMDTAIKETDDDE